MRRVSPITPGGWAFPPPIVMPVTTPFNKVKHTRDFGATVIQHGRDLNEAYAEAQRIAAQQRLTFIHPYDDPLVIAGQGTCALEMLQDVPQLDALIVPVGGGGLISGCAIAAKAMKPAIEIYGVQTELYPAMRKAMRNEPVTETPPAQTIAEGIAVKRPGTLTTKIVRDLVRDIFLVGEDRIEHALAMILEIEKTLIEGAAAAGFAALLANRAQFQGRHVGIVMSGGNIDMRPALQRHPARTDARGPHLLAGAADRGSSRPACPDRRPDCRGRRQCAGSLA